MNRDCGRLVLLCALVLLVLSTSVVALEPKGVEFQVNTYTIGFQGPAVSDEAPAVGVNADGDFVVVWTSVQQGGSYPKYGVFGQRFSDAGDRLASEFQIGLFTSYWGQSHPATTAVGDGGFVVVWQSYELDGSNGYGVFGRRFSSTGDALAAEFQVNTYTYFDQRRPALAAAGNGDFVVIWDSTHQDGDDLGVFAQRFSSAGARIGAEIQASTYTTGFQSQSTVAVAANGTFVLAWVSDYQDGEGWSVFGRAFSSSGVALASEFQINAHTSGSQGYPSAAALSDGSFVVAWASPGDGDSTGIFARRLSSAGGAVGDQFQINVFTPSIQTSPSVAAGPGIGFVVNWESEGQDGNGNGIFARRFANDGSPSTGDFQVNTFTAYGELRPAAAAAPGGLVVTWISQAQDGSDNGIFGQRLSVPIPLDIDGNGSTAYLSDGVLVLRYLFGLTGATLVNGAVDQGGCTRCDGAAIEPYLAGLGTKLDVDDDGSLRALTDGLLVLRYMFGLTGVSLTNGAVDLDDCDRCTATEIESYLVGVT